MVTWGILLMVAAFLVTCTVGATRAGSNPYASGFEAGQNPLFLLGLCAGIALTAVGAAKKANATREARQRLRDAVATTELVPSDKVPGGPFRGALDEVKVPDPALAAAEAAEYEERRSRGTVYLTIGFVVLGLTLVISGVMMGSNHGSAHQRFDRIFMTFGAAVFPFGLGLWLTIKGALLRSKH